MAAPTRSREAGRKEDEEDWLGSAQRESRGQSPSCPHRLRGPIEKLYELDTVRGDGPVPRKSGEREEEDGAASTPARCEPDRASASGELARVLEQVPVLSSAGSEVARARAALIWSDDATSNNNGGSWSGHIAPLLHKHC